MGTLPLPGSSLHIHIATSRFIIGNSLQSVDVVSPVSGKHDIYYTMETQVASTQQEVGPIISEHIFRVSLRKLGIISMWLTPSVSSDCCFHHLDMKGKITYQCADWKHKYVSCGEQISLSCDCDQTLSTQPINILFPGLLPNRAVLAGYLLTW